MMYRELYYNYAVEPDIGLIDALIEGLPEAWEIYTVPWGETFAQANTPAEDAFRIYMKDGTCSQVIFTGMSVDEATDLAIHLTLEVEHE